MNAIALLAEMLFNELMSDLLIQFEQDCKKADVKPEDAVKRAGLHPMNWWRWSTGKVSPTLKNFEAARDGLTKIVTEQDARQST